MKKLYAVPWIEVEYGWGSRPEGYKVFDNLNECISETLKDTQKGNYSDGYFGPVRPLHYYETPDEIISDKFPMFVNKLEYKSESVYISPPK